MPLIKLVICIFKEPFVNVLFLDEVCEWEKDGQLGLSAFSPGYMPGGEMPGRQAQAHQFRSSLSLLIKKREHQGRRTEWARGDGGEHVRLWSGQKLEPGSCTRPKRGAELFVSPSEDTWRLSPRTVPGSG